MKLSYDPARNIAYLRLRTPAAVQVETIRVSDELNVDLAADGSVYGIELLNANEQLGAPDGLFVLDLGGTQIELPFPEVEKA